MAPAKAQPNLEAASSFNPEGFQNGEGEILWRLPLPRRAQEQTDGQVKTSTPEEEGWPNGEGRGSQAWLDFLRYSAR